MHSARTKVILTTDNWPTKHSFGRSRGRTWEVRREPDIRDNGLHQFPLVSGAQRRHKYESQIERCYNFHDPRDVGCRWRRSRSRC